MCPVARVLSERMQPLAAAIHLADLFEDSVLVSMPQEELVSEPVCLRREVDRGLARGNQLAFRNERRRRRARATR